MSLQESDQSEKLEQSLKSRGRQVYEGDGPEVAAPIAKKTVQDYLREAKPRPLSLNLKLMLAGGGGVVVLMLAASLILGGRRPRLPSGPDLGGGRLLANASIPAPDLGLPKAAPSPPGPDLTKSGAEASKPRPE